VSIIKKFENSAWVQLKLTKIGILILAVLFTGNNAWAEEIKKEEVITQKGLSMKVETFNDQVFFEPILISIFCT